MVVNPYLRQCAPPEFSATLPPMCRRIATRDRAHRNIPCGATGRLRGLDYAGFDDDALVGNVDFEDAVHAGEADDDSTLTGSAPPLRPVPDPRATNGIFSRRADFQDRLHLFRGSRKKTAEGRVGNW